MRTDDNWKKVRLLTQDLEVLLDLPKQSTEEFCATLQDLVIHRFLEQVAEDEDPRNKDYEIILPYIGSLIVTINDKNKISTDFVVRSAFYHDLRKAYNSRQSPLVSRCARVLGKDLVKRFESEGENHGL